MNTLVISVISLLICYILYCFIAIEMGKKLHQTHQLFLFCDKIQNNYPISIKS